MKNPVGIGTMTSKGQITIPREIRKKLNLKQGEQLLFVAGEDEVLIRKIDKQDLIKSLYEKACQSEPEDIPLNKEEQEQMDSDEGYVSLEEAKRELGL